jgi:hypothetical protein
MKRLLILSFLFVVLSSFSIDDKGCCDKKGGKCTGSAYCTACKNCSGCKHCNAGGTCGVCAKPVKSKTTTKQTTPVSSGQCKATTKKGSRCSRTSRTGGYCWQHGG